MSEATLHRWTHDDLARLPDDGKRYEILRGELCMTAAPGTRHQRIVARIDRLVGTFVDEHGLGELLIAPLDVRLSEHDVVEPDLLFIRAARRDIVGEAHVAGPPDLAIEVASDSTRERDRTVKLELYASARVGEYWIVDPDSGLVCVHRRPEGRTFAERRNLGPESTLTTPLLPGLEVTVAELLDA